MTKRTRPVALRTIAGVAAVLAALLAFVPAASAARDPISGGTTDLHLKQGFLKKLTNLGVGLAGVSTGQVGGSKISMPVGEGMFDPTNAQGHFKSPGGFQLVKGAHSVPITGVETNTVRGALYATVAGAHMQFGTLSPITAGREGFGARIKANQLTLTQKAANRISNYLHLQGAKRINQRVMSNAFGITVPSTVTLVGGGSATLAGSSSTFAKFGQKGVERPQGITAIAPATKPKSETFQLPVTGGTLALNGTGGTVATIGGIQILKQTKTLSPQLRISNVVLELATKSGTAELETQPVPPFTGLAPRAQLVELVIPGNSIQTNTTTRQITMKGVEAKLVTGAASTFNTVFNQPEAGPPNSDFAAGELLGTFTLNLQAQ
ncbi:MAG TPA: hypothetical protein VMH33_12610 [Solirubrobacterales bacterium]|nr:hypothetical protein [Solirubrobacterales bacterium]